MLEEEAQSIDRIMETSILGTSSVASVKGKVILVRTMELYWRDELQRYLSNFGTK
jgi:hypothetical protein